MPWSSAEKKAAYNKAYLLAHPDVKEHRRRVKQIWNDKNRDLLAEQQSRYREKHKERLKLQHRERHLQRSYGLSLEMFASLSAIQDNRCAICRAVTVLYVDHDHQYGHIRGLLCMLCNAALGGFRDDAYLVERALVYLGRPFGHA